MDDKSLDIRVHTALSENPDYKFSDVIVDAFKGQMQLSGFVDQPDQKSRAVEIAQHVHGVKEVVNNISVKP